MNNLAVAREMERAEEDATRFYQDIFNEGNGNLVFPNSTSADEVTNISSPLQENGELFRFEEDAVSTADTFTSAAEAINIETQKSPQGSWKTIQKRILVPRLRTLIQN